MTQVTAKKSYIKDADGNYIVPFVNPADNDNLGVVKADGSTITSTSGILTSPLATEDFINNSKALKTGEVSYNQIIYNDVKNYAHSTFDRSKFTVVGTPVITDDGIVSSLSSTNGIYYQTLKPNTASWEIGIEQEVTAEALTNNTTSSTSAFVFFTDGADKGVNVQTYYGNANYDNFVVAIKFSDGTSTSGMNCTSSGKYIAGDKQKLVLGYDGIDTYYFKAYKNGVLYASSTYTTTTSQIIQQDANYNTIGFRRGTRGNYNKIDLKTFYEKINGVIVLSGNKTGVDTIKSDDYTIVGSPTITDDGVVTNTSTNNYIQTPTAWNIGNKNFRFEFDYKLPSVAVTNSLMLMGGENSNSNGIFQFYYTGSNGNLTFRTWVDNSGTVEYISAFAVRSPVANNTYNVYVEKIGSTITFGHKNSNSTSWETKILNTEYPIYNTINAQKILYSDNYGITIDLNTVKLYIDGNLVYQPCLKIPYTSSKSGSKVVDSVYRDRITDMYSQFGYSPYYTLSDIDFTLPQVELYGNIQQTLRQSTVSGVNQNYLYSDRMQIQTGTCTSGVEVTLPKPFSDGNYALTIPYSAKSATAFTPTATGDWIAIGLGNL